MRVLRVLGVLGGRTFSGCFSFLLREAFKAFGFFGGIRISLIRDFIISIMLPKHVEADIYSVLAVFKLLHMILEQFFLLFLQLIHLGS